MDTQTREWRYGVKPGAGFSEDEAELIVGELEEIAGAKPEEGITAERFVEAAASGDAPTCASLLEWNDDKAGHNWRLHQARQALNHITLIEADEEGEETEIRAFHVVSVDVSNGDVHKERRYVPLSIVREDENLVKQVIAQAKEELLRAKNKLAHYEDHVREHAPELARVMDAVSENLEALEEDGGE